MSIRKDKREEGRRKTHQKGAYPSFNVAPS